jgi:plastocyanin
MPEVGAVRVEGPADATDDGPTSDGPSDRSEGSPQGDAGPVTVTVTVAPNDSHTFSPPMVRLRVGDTVHWVWAASGHTVTSGSGGNPDGLFCSTTDTNCSGAPTSPTGTTYDHRFVTAGTFPYFCRPHVGSGMSGSIIVE